MDMRSCGSRLQQTRRPQAGNVVTNAKNTCYRFHCVQRVIGPKVVATSCLPIVLCCQAQGFSKTQNLRQEDPGIAGRLQMCCRVRDPSSSCAVMRAIAYMPSSNAVACLIANFEDPSSLCNVIPSLAGRPINAGLAGRLTSLIAGCEEPSSSCTVAFLKAGSPSMGRYSLFSLASSIRFSACIQQDRHACARHEPQKAALLAALCTGDVLSQHASQRAERSSQLPQIWCAC